MFTVVDNKIVKLETDMALMLVGNKIVYDVTAEKARYLAIATSRLYAAFKTSNKVGISYCNNTEMEITINGKYVPCTFDKPFYFEPITYEVIEAELTNYLRDLAVHELSNLKKRGYYTKNNTLYVESGFGEVHCGSIKKTKYINYLKLDEIKKLF